MFKDFLSKYFPSLYSSINSVSQVDYKGVEDYRKDLDSINKELLMVNETIEYYSLRRKQLTSWKKSIEKRIGEDESSNCCNCKFYNNRFCSKYKFTVEADATCHSFEWNTESES